jgi:hypothetical protein
MSAVRASLLDHFFLLFRASSNFAAALIRAICTSSSLPRNAVPHTSFGLARHNGQRIDRGLIGRYSGILVFAMVFGLSIMYKNMRNVCSCRYVRSFQATRIKQELPKPCSSSRRTIPRTSTRSS